MSRDAIEGITSLPDVPNEVLLLIFDRLFDEQRAQAGPGLYGSLIERPEYNHSTAYSTLYALARTCHRLYDVAMKVFYQKCVWEFLHPPAAFVQGTAAEPNCGHYGDCRYIEILRDRTVDGRSDYYVRRSQEELETSLATREDWPADVRTTLAEDPAQIDLALLVARSPNLRQFSMDAFHRDLNSATSFSLPVWLYPIVQVARNNLVNGTNDPFYNNLRTIDIHMQYMCTPDVAYLFALPSLRTLRLNAIQNLDPFDGEAHWPVQKRSSLVDTLILHEVNIPGTFTRLLITSCEALSRFEYDHHPSGIGRNGNMPSSYFTEIMSGLEQQQDSLHVLHLDAHDEDFMVYHEDTTYARVDGFDKLYALQRLSTAFRTLLGRPRAHDCDWRYPHVRDILPHSLQELSFRMTPEMVFEGYQREFVDLFLSALPLEGKESHLRKVRVDYEYMVIGRPLPFSFWDIKNTYLKHRVEFDYSISAEPDYLALDGEDMSVDEQINCLVSILVRDGPKAVEMAHHFKFHGQQMVPKVLSRLDYPEDWTSSEEGRKYMFTS